MVKSQKGRKVSDERKVGDCVQWRATGQCSKGDSCSFSRGQRAQSSSPAPTVPTQTDGRKPYEGNSPRGESPPGVKESV